jgi:hypothetical protein
MYTWTITFSLSLGIGWHPWGLWVHLWLEVYTGCHGLWFSLEVLVRLGVTFVLLERVLIAVVVCFERQRKVDLKVSFEENHSESLENLCLLAESIQFTFHASFSLPDKT